MGESEDRLLKKRFSELAARADSQGYWTQTAFLSPAEQALLLTLRLPFPPCAGWRISLRRTPDSRLWQRGALWGPVCLSSCLPMHGTLVPPVCR